MVDLKKYEATFLKQTKNIAKNLERFLKILSCNLDNEIAWQEGKRLSHTLKGSAALMKCENLSQLAKELEEFFSDRNFKKQRQVEHIISEILRRSDSFKGLQKINSILDF